MPIWDKVKQELDRAGRMAQGALDEGRIRIDAYRARQLADKAAQALGYAVYRARQQGQDLDPDTYARLSSTLAGREAEAKRHEERLAALSRTGRPPAGPSAAGPADTPRGGGAADTP